MSCHLFRMGVVTLVNFVLLFGMTATSDAGLVPCIFGFPFGSCHSGYYAPAPVNCAPAGCPTGCYGPSYGTMYSPVCGCAPACGPGVSSGCGPCPIPSYVIGGCGPAACPDGTCGSGDPKEPGTPVERAPVPDRYEDRIAPQASPPEDRPAPIPTDPGLDESDDIKRDDGFRPRTRPRDSDIFDSDAAGSEGSPGDTDAGGAPPFERSPGPDDDASTLEFEKPTVPGRDLFPSGDDSAPNGPTSRRFHRRIRRAIVPSLRLDHRITTYTTTQYDRLAVRDRSITAARTARNSRGGRPVQWIAVPQSRIVVR